MTKQSARAQVMPDNTLLGSEQSIVTSGTDDSSFRQQIEGGAIRGTNLFHSFRDFNIAEGQSVYFYNPVGIQNIISRVTGDAPSNIEGTLGVLGDAGNVFLLNPNGIFFGPDARLDVSGSFVATTATSIQFGTQGMFSSSVTESPSLLTVNPSAFWFAQVDPAAIINRSSALSVAPSASVGQGLQVPDGKSLLLLGGDVNLIGGGVSAAGGQVALGAVAGAGTVGLNLDENNNFRLSFPKTLARADISFASGASVDTSGERGGAIQIVGRRVSLNSGAQVVGFTQGAQPGKDLIVNASESLEVIGSVPFGNLSTLSFGDGNAGDLIIETQRLRVLEGAQILSGTIGNGSAGQLTVNASDFVEVGQGNRLNNTFSGVASFTSGAGQAGNLTVNTNRLIVRDGGVLSAQSLFATGDEEPSVGAAEGGILTINAADSVTLSKEGLINISTQNPGNAGQLIINTTRLLVQNNSDITAESTATGNAGNITVQAQSVVIEDQSSIRARTTASQGGNITLQVSDLLLLRQGSYISTSAGTAQAGGDGGDITLNLPDGIIVAVPTEDSDIRANAFEGDGGNVTITARSLLGITFRPNVLDTPLSDITVSSEFGNSGNANINELNSENPQTEIDLPTDTALPPLAQGCRTPGSPSSSFVSTGRGGLPTNPVDPLSTDTIWQDLTPVNLATTDPVATMPIRPMRDPIVEAQGWARSRDGTVSLLSQATAVSSAAASTAASGSLGRREVSAWHQCGATSQRVIR